MRYVRAAMRWKIFCQERTMRKVKRNALIVTIPMEAKTGTSYDKKNFECFFQ